MPGLLLDPPEVRDAGLRVEHRLALAIPDARLRRDHLDHQNDVLPPEEGLPPARDGVGPDDADVRLGPLGGIEDHAHLPPDAVLLRGGATQLALQQRHHAHVEGGSRAREDQASVDQLGVCGQVREVVEVFGGEALGRWERWSAHVSGRA
ncbi:hypothetical protein GCM10009734_89030 [Nonomuraea bangladeshensis]